LNAWHVSNSTAQAKESYTITEILFRSKLKELKLISKNKADFVGTTLSVSPYKNATALYEIGKKIEAEMGITFLPADFKKRGGYQHSIELSRQYDLYRQPYCGCVFSYEQFKARISCEEKKS
jgi:predicted adenine nucleotide alpha hydrolase (AANH) superfamily ATPase